jgi:hypothetical protein
MEQRARLPLGLINQLSIVGLEESPMNLGPSDVCLSTLIMHLSLDEINNKLKTSNFPPNLPSVRVNSGLVT